MEEKIRYKEKLFDKKWIEKRKEILARDQNSCKICGKKDVKLIVHHKQYHFIKKLQKHADPWDYDNRYLVTLCENCHTRGHGKYDVPIKYI